MKALIAFIIIINILSCGDDGSNCPGDMNLPLKIGPYKLFYHLGDTITISSKFYKLLYDQKTDKFYDVSKYNFSPIISFYSIDNVETNLLGSQVLQYSNIIELDSSIMNIVFFGTENAIVGEYKLESDSLNFQIKLKLKKTGYYWLKIESLTSGDGHMQNNYQFNCRSRYINFHLEFPKDNNIQLMEKFRTTFPNDYYLEDSINRFYNHAGYCLEVR